MVAKNNNPSTKGSRLFLGKGVALGRDLILWFLRFPWIWSHSLPPRIWSPGPHRVRNSSRASRDTQPDENIPNFEPRPWQPGSSIPSWHSMKILMGLSGLLYYPHIFLTWKHPRVIQQINEDFNWSTAEVPTNSNMRKWGCWSSTATLGVGGHGRSQVTRNPERQEGKIKI